MLVETILIEKKLIHLPDKAIAIVALACLFTTIYLSVIKQKPKKRRRSQQKMEYCR